VQKEGSVHPAYFDQQVAASSGTNWIETHTGLQFFFDNPTPDMIDIRDIAWHLSGINRYTGAGHVYLSVAEHSLNISYAVPEEDAFAGLMHDAAEAYMGDVSAPLKRFLPDYRVLEVKVWCVIAQKFGLPIALPASIRDADRRITLNEKRVLFPNTKNDWAIRDDPLEHVYIQSLPQVHAYIRFLRRYNQLTGSNITIYHMGEHRV
jgi:hypothetical protein